MRLFMGLLAIGLFASARAIAQPDPDIIEGKWKGKLTLMSEEYDITLNLEKQAENIYEGKAITDITKKSRTHASHITYKFRCEYKNGVFETTARENAALRVIMIKASGIGNCVLQSKLFFSEDNQMPTLAGSHHASPCSGTGYLKLTKQFSLAELTAYNEKKRIADSLHKIRYAKNKFTYFNCDSTAALNAISKKNPSWFFNKDCDKYNIYGRYGDTGLTYNQPFNDKDRYFSDSTSLCLKSGNFYDGRFLGTWHTMDYKFIYKFFQSDDRYSPFKIRCYAYSEQEKKYVEFDQKESQVFTTHIDSFYFLENRRASWPNDKYQYVRVPAEYNFIDYNHMVLNPVSGAYTLDTKQFKSSDDYREYFLQNRNQPGFYFHELHLYRHIGDNPTKQADQIIADQNQQEALLALAGLILIGLFLTDDGPSPAYRDAYQSDTRVIEGYDRYYNPVYNSGVSTGGQIYYDPKGHRVDQ